MTQNSLGCAGLARPRSSRRDGQLPRRWWVLRPDARHVDYAARLSGPHREAPAAQDFKAAQIASRLKNVTAEKLEIIQLVEQSHLPVRRSLEQIGIPKSTFYRWCDLYQTGGPEALDDCSPRPDRVWNRIPDDVRARIVRLALDEPELSPHELAG